MRCSHLSRSHGGYTNKRDHAAPLCTRAALIQSRRVGGFRSSVRRQDRDRLDAPADQPPGHPDTPAEWIQEPPAVARQASDPQPGSNLIGKAVRRSPSDCARAESRRQCRSSAPAGSSTCPNSRQPRGRGSDRVKVEAGKDLHRSSPLHGGTTAAIRGSVSISVSSCARRGAGVLVTPDPPMHSPTTTSKPCSRS